MGYKITKYKGKHKIKNTKTGKSTEIDIEKFMNGGYKTFSEYAEGGVYTDGGKEGGCPDWDPNCDQIGKESTSSPYSPEPLDYSIPPDPNAPLTYGQTGSSNVATPTGYNMPPNPNTTTSTNRAPLQKVSAISDLTPAGINTEGTHEYATQGASKEEQKVKLSSDIKENDEKKEDDQYQMFNPYVGVDIAAGATHLGQSIENGNTLGIVAGGLKVAAGIGRNVFSGMGLQNRENERRKNAAQKIKDEKTQYQHAEFGGEYQKLAYGGKKEEELATGEYMRGVNNPDTQEFNVEIEKGEYFQSNEGDISEVVGNKHSEGEESGEKIKMEEGDRVLTDKLKIGKDVAKELSSKYDLKLKSKDSYSTVLDKFKRKSKLNKLIDEESEVIKKIDSQSDVKDETTRNFNLEVLAKKKQEIEEKKHPIEEQRKGVFEELYNIQEASKPKSKETANFADGGSLDGDCGGPGDPCPEVLTAEQDKLYRKVQENKGSFKPGLDYKEEAQMHFPEIPQQFKDRFAKVDRMEGKQNPNITKKNRAVIQREYEIWQKSIGKSMNASDRMMQTRLEPQEFADGGTISRMADEYDISPDRAKELLQEFRDGGEIVPKYEEGSPDPEKRAQQVKRLEDWFKEARGLGFEGEINLEADNLGAEAGKLQRFMVEKNPQSVIDYFRKSKQPMTSRGIDLLKESNPKVFKELGLKERSNPADYTDEEKALLYDKLDSSGEITDDFLLDQFTDDKWDWRRPAVAGLSGVQEMGVNTDLNMKPSTGVEDEGGFEETKVPGGSRWKAPSPVAPSEGIVETEEEKKRNMGMMLFPDTYVRPPSALQTPVKLRTKLDRVRGMEINIDPQLQGVRDREATSMQSLEGLSPNVRAAVMANVRAQTQNDESKLYAGKDNTELASEQQAVYSNADIQAKEDSMNNQHTYQYDANTSQAIANTDADLDGYYNQLQAIHKQKYTDIHNLNLINATNEDVAYMPGQGYIRKNSDQEIGEKAMKPYINKNA